MEINLNSQEYEIQNIKPQKKLSFRWFQKTVDFSYKYGGFYFIISICVFLQLFLDIFLLNGGLADRLQWGANIAPLFPIEYFRFINAIFLHGGWLHLAVNMLSLYYLSKQSLEVIWDTPKVFLTFLLSGMSANIISFIIRSGVKGASIVSVGASAGVFGLVGALLAYYIFNKKLSKSAKKFYLKQITSILFLNILIGLMIPNIDMTGHFLGLVTGFILGFIIEKLPYGLYKQKKNFWGFLWLISTLLLIISFISATISYWAVTIR